MSLSQVLLPPPTERGFDEWSFAHAQHHLAIAGALLQVKKVSVVLPPLWPINLSNVEVWLENHQFVHNQQNSELGIQGNDLESFNWQDEKQRAGFFFLNFIEHRSAGQNVGLPI